jgi:ABC-type nitrate/sulfonate/bicarbonate transport system substrate-binding protein
MKNSSGRAKLCLAVSFVPVLLNSPSVMAAAKTQLRVAYSSISGSAIVTWIALDKGLFGKYDLDVELIYVAGSQANAVSSRRHDPDRHSGHRACLSRQRAG